MGGEHVHGEKPEPSGDEYRSHESENERGASGRVRMRASRRPKGERVSGGFVVRGLANRPNRRSGGTHVKRRKSFNVGEKSLPKLDLPKVRRNERVEIIPLSTGCLGQCTYCKTKHARGELGSYEIEAIIGRAKLAIEEGVTEIWLSKDTGARTD